ncbi:PDZ domain-containing protein [bacterium]|nr:PDZ domain-containing protein [bacterium]NBX97606.1 PDZ domain-containing protein [bacterium]NDC94561.1 PDZ domain-containing protein [bacterium]NDD84144.1 PDZ domain-containing protein [bacterium]NDG29969.1 PDZ domain-containing protein [bacterium]
MVKKDATNDTNTDQTVKSKTTTDSVKTHKPMAQTRWALPIVAAVIAGFIGGYFAPNNSQANVAGTPTEIQQRVIGSESELVRDIVKNVGPAVVSINVTSQGMAQNFFGMTQSFDQEGAGTGFIIDADGTIVTNRHVVPSGTKTVSVTLSDGTELNDVEVIGRTNDSDPLDVAFLKIKDKKGKTLTAAKIGDSSKVQVGDKVVAIGNALGQFQNTVTSGIISGYGRSIEAGDQSGASTETLQNLFQTDAAINQGNSGGPLVNLSGEVIGINTAVAGGSAQNIGFSIPVDDIKGLITSVLKNGKLQRPFLGVRYVMITDDFAYQYNLPVKRGAYIAPQVRQDSIIKGSPADKAGLKEKDIITEINGVKLDEKNSIISVLGKRSVGDVAELKVLREGKEITLKATLEAAPAQ